MTVHILKLSVGSESLEQLAAWQNSRLRGRRQDEVALTHVTRMFPRRAEEVLDGGSIYWVIKGVIQARQRIIDLRAVRTPDGTDRCAIVYEPELIAVRPTPRRAFQGWRYLKPEDAPADLGSLGVDAADVPTEMRNELAELGLL
ncbi:MAG: DUF1489 domain-containing protein [Pseudomonadota bacterium]